MLELGDTFILPKSSGAIEHLWILITCPKNNCSVGVNLTKLRPNADKTVVLQPGEHPFIKVESIILYSDARYIELIKLSEMLGKGSFNFTCSTHSRCTPPFLTKVQRGLLVSPFTPNAIKDYCRNVWAGDAALNARIE